MELPQELVILIKEFAKPISRPDWRQGCIWKRYNGSMTSAIRGHIYVNFERIYPSIIKIVLHN
jgi:hypothetical protein